MLRSSHSKSDPLSSSLGSTLKVDDARFSFFAFRLEARAMPGLNCPSALYRFDNRSDGVCFREIGALDFALQCWYAV